MSGCATPPAVNATARFPLAANEAVFGLGQYQSGLMNYRGHEVVWREASPFTPDEIRELDALCRERYVELVPNQNSLGHLHRWLVHEPYRQLAEQLQMTEGAVKVAVHRLRNRCAELLRAEIAETVSSEEEIDDELRSLFAAVES